MSIHITLTPAEERKLAELARAHGTDLAGYAHNVVSAYLKIAESSGTGTIEEIVTPIWDTWRQSGMSDVEVDDLFEQELQAARVPLGCAGEEEAVSVIRKSCFSASSPC